MMNTSLTPSSKIRRVTPLATAKPPQILNDIINPAGVKFNGDAPWDIQVHDNSFYKHIFNRGSLGFGETYMQGLWSCGQLDELFNRLLGIDIDHEIERLSKIRLLISIVRYRLQNLQSEARAYQVARQHYDIGNDIFEAMLDPTMSYSCGYWKNARNLQQAQQHKLNLICQKLELKAGEKLLDIGCGWGGLAHYAATHYGVSVTGITVSKEQQKLAQLRCKDLPVTIKLTDYRKLQGQYDKVVSVGMFEHVGKKNYPEYFQTVHQLMKNHGIFLLHTIGHYKTVTHVDPWIDKYIFPNGKIPSALDLTEALEESFIIEDWHNFGQDYDKTLMAWWNNFDQAWPMLQINYTPQFYRMWQYYLLSCAGFFRARQGLLWQLVLTKRCRHIIYRSIR